MYFLYLKTFTFFGYSGKFINFQYCSYKRHLDFWQIYVVFETNTL